MKWTYAYLALPMLMVTPLAHTGTKPHSPAEARQTCESLLVEYAEGKSDPLIDALAAGNPINADDAEELIHASRFPAAGLAFAYSLGDQDVFNAMWPAATRFGPEVFEDWKWSLLSESAMCANHEAVEFLIDKGLDPNMRKEGIVDLMMVAIMNHDPLVAEALFESGYARCHAVVTNNGLTLLHMADNVGFGAFRGLHAEYCAS